MEFQGLTEVSRGAKGGRSDKEDVIDLVSNLSWKIKKRAFRHYDMAGRWSF